jgi:uncharacterized protein
MDSNSFLAINKKTILYQLVHLKQLVFEVTDACNLRCKYCGYADLYEGYDLRENKNLSFTKAQLIIDYLVDLWRNNTHISIVFPIAISFYGGEPLMNMKFIKDVVDYLDKIKGVNRQYFFTMTTNAMLLDKHMDYLVEKKFRLLISLDGDEHAQSYRVDASGKNSFDRVIKNIGLLQNKYPDYFRRYVSFNSVLHNRNNVQNTFHFIKNLFSKETTIAPLNNSGIKKDKIEEFWQTYQNIESSIQQSLNCETLQTELFIKNPRTKRLLTYLHTYSGNVYNNFNDLFINEDQLQHYPTGTCPPFFKKMFITVNGKILQCEKINHEFAIGIISEDKVILDLDKIVEQHNNYIFRYQKQCMVCAVKRNCPQCVFQIDDINNPDTKCLNFRNKQAMEKYEKDNMDYLRNHPELYGRIMRDVRTTH